MSMVLPHSYSTVSANGKFVFVMLAPGDSANSERVGRNTESQKLSAKYLFSGLYQNDGSTTPLWTVNWYSYKILVPNDGIHLVRFGRTHSRADDAFTFLENGKEVCRYKVADLIDTSWFLTYSDSHLEWENKIELDETRHTLYVSTLSNESFIFDYTTGKMVSARRPLRATVVGLVIPFSFLTVWLIKRESERRRK